jgi:hypothetical protein
MSWSSGTGDPPSAGSDRATIARWSAPTAVTTTSDPASNPNTSGEFGVASWQNRGRSGTPGPAVADTPGGPGGGPDGEPDGEPHGEPDGDPDGENVGDPDGEPDGENVGEPDGEPDGENVNEPDGEITEPDGSADGVNNGPGLDGAGAAHGPVVAGATPVARASAQFVAVNGAVPPTIIPGNRSARGTSASTTWPPAEEANM